MKKEVYIFSGLGADERVFQKIDFSSYHATFIHWITPVSKETIEQYAFRLLDQIRSEGPVLIGLSFGGIMAVEVAKLIKTEKIILISSAKTKKEIPYYYRFAGFAGIHHILPGKFLKNTNPLLFWLFGTNSIFEKKLLKQILADTDAHFLKWAISQIVLWKNNEEHKNLIHIHGTKDHILPIRFVKYDYKVLEGGHFMILNKEAEINKMLQQLI